MKGTLSVVFTTFLTALCVVAAVADDVPPECPFTVDDEIILLPNSANCSNFYSCVYGKAIRLDCPKDLLFCSENAACAYFYDKNCSFSDCAQVTAHELRQADEPDCPFSSEEKEVLLVDPANCSNFYSCIYGRLIPLHCPKDLLFCSENGACSYFYDKNCSFSDCAQVTAHELRQADEPDCPFSSEDKEVLLVDPANCSNFYSCIYGRLIPLHCPKDLLFCSENGACSYFYDKNCSFSDCAQVTAHELRQADEPDCPFSSEDKEVLLVDPANCSNFYSCIYGRLIPLHCPKDLLFCSENGACSYFYDKNCSFSDCAQVTAHELRQADEPDCPFSSEDKEVLLVDPANCSNFYSCIYGRLIPLHCPKDLLFCSENGACSYFYDKNCSFSDCAQVTAHELRQADEPDCPFTVDDEIILLPNPANCSNFFSCVYGKAIPLDCPKDLLFCSENGACAYFYDKNCSFSDCAQVTAHELRQADDEPPCPVVQANETVLLPNSQNCSTFYECLPIAPAEIFECPKGTYFCSELSQCTYFYDKNCSFSDCVMDTAHELRQAEEPDCPFTVDDEIILLPNPANCSNFFSCVYGKAIPLDCPKDLLFCSENGACAYFYDKNCSFSDCAQVTAHELRQADDEPPCPVVQANETVLLPNSQNCSTFYECLPIAPAEIFECPKGTYFCSELSQCTYFYDKNCSFSDCVMDTAHELRQAEEPDCPFTVDDEIILLPNPANCSNFFSCVYGKAIPLDCPKDLLFCSENGACAYFYDKNCSFSDCAQVTAHELRQAEDEPPCPVVQANETVLLPNSQNCSTFYECLPIAPAEIFECPKGTYFCSELSQCTYFYDKNCSFSDCVMDTAHELRQAEEPDCPFTVDDEIILLPNPANCSNFFSCVYGKAIPLDCPKDLLFCSENGACAYFYDKNCSFSDCAQVTAHELRQAEEPNCPFTADNETVLLPNSEDCGTFFECALGKPVLFDCPVDLQFCSEKNLCSYSYDKECSYSDCTKKR